MEQGLSDAEFTAQRMMRLELWTKERKRLQHNLHYKYDPSRRSRRLVNRDVDRQLAKAGAELKGLLDRVSSLRSAKGAGTTDSHEAPAAGPAVDPSVFEMIKRDTGLPDPTTATDGAVLSAHEARGQGGYPAQYFLSVLRGRPVPERPAGLG